MDFHTSKRHYSEAENEACINQRGTTAASLTLTTAIAYHARTKVIYGRDAFLPKQTEPFLHILFLYTSLSSQNTAKDAIVTIPIEYNEQLLLG